MWELTNGFGDFNLSWRRNLFEWEGRLLSNLLEVLEGFVCTKGTNYWKWKPKENGLFSISSMYMLFEKL